MSTLKLTAAQASLLQRVVEYPGGLPYAHVGSRRSHFVDARVLVASGLIREERYTMVATEAGRGLVPGGAS